VEYGVGSGNVGAGAGAGDGAGGAAQETGTSKITNINPVAINFFFMMLRLPTFYDKSLLFDDK